MVIGLFFMILIIAWLVRELLEAMLAPLFDNIPPLSKVRWLQIYIAIAASIGLAFFYQLDVIFVIARWVELEWSTFMFVTWVGITMTGAAIGLGANFLHRLFEYIVEQWEWLRKLLGRNGEQA